MRLMELFTSSERKLSIVMVIVIAAIAVGGSREETAARFSAVQCVISD